MTDAINPNGRYVLVTDNELPPKTNAPTGDEHRWPFEIMEVGESFDEPDVGAFDRVRNFASMYGYKHSRKYATRVMKRDAALACPVCDTTFPLPPQFVMRVWRVE